MSNPRRLLEEYGIHPQKKWGQNFLFDPNSLRKIVSIADIQPNDTVLEIGTGTGALTHFLAEAAARVLTVEIDERLIPLLRDEFSEVENVELYWMDFLDFDLEDTIGDEPYKVIANLPYYITSKIIRKLLETRHKAHSLTLTMQKQVAEQIIAKPNDMSLLAVSVQFYGKPTIEMTLKPTVFYPRPGVDSSVLYVDIYPEPLVKVPDAETFFEVVRAGFGQKRKQLKNSLSHNLGISNEQAAAMLDAAGIDSTRRAETMTLEEWAVLTRIYANKS
jgi:16S rRNA (adenine1518-N6/adenine1519-N6)-dimethyltransferase